MSKISEVTSIEDLVTERDMRIMQLEDRNAELVAALEYYANIGGTVARAALTKVKEGK